MVQCGCEQMGPQLQPCTSVRQVRGRLSDNPMTDTKINQLVLEELRELRGSFNSFATDTDQRLTAIETRLAGTPGPGRFRRATGPENRSSFTAVNLTEWQPLTGALKYRRNA
jgi:hypothetical protein